jgi:hypothetical protein
LLLTLAEFSKYLLNSANALLNSATHLLKVAHDSAAAAGSTVYTHPEWLTTSLMYSHRLFQCRLLQQTLEEKNEEQFKKYVVRPQHSI